MTNNRTIRGIAAVVATCATGYLFFVMGAATVHRASGSFRFLDELPFVDKWALKIAVVAFIACLAIALIQLHSSRGYNLREKVIGSVILLLCHMVFVPFFLWWNVRHAERRAPRAGLYACLALYVALVAGAVVFDAVMIRRDE